MAEFDHSITAIIPLYNGAKHIEGALRSVWAQTLPASEVIVVDDGSADDGPQVVERLSNEEPVILLRKSNGGQSSARNYGVKHSNSRLIAFLDQDDLWYPNHLSELHKAFLAHERGLPLGWVYSDLDEIDESGLMVRRCLISRFANEHPKLAHEHPKRTLIGSLSKDMFILPSASLIDRAAFESVGGFDERLSGYEDDDLFLRMFRAGFDNLYLDKPLSLWRIHLESTSYSERMSRSRLIYLNKLIEAYPDDTHRNVSYRSRCIAPRFMRTILAEYYRCYRAKNRAGMIARLDDLKVLIPFLSRKRRFLFSIGLPLMRHYPLVALFSHSPRLLRALAARLANI